MQGLQENLGVMRRRSGVVIKETAIETGCRLYIQVPSIKAAGEGA
jgi:hypothetical protein